MRQGGAPHCRSVSLLDAVEISAYAPFDNAAIAGRCPRVQLSVIGFHAFLKLKRTSARQ